MNKKILVPLIILIVLCTSIFAYLKIKKEPKAGFIEGPSDAITQLPKRGSATSIIINFSKCSRGSDTVYFAMGSSHFAFEGINNEKCVFYYGMEIENPRWDRTLGTKCSVPVKLGEKSYTVGSFGVSLEDLKEYCVTN